MNTSVRHSNVIMPPSLSLGDKVAVVAPSGPVTKEGLKEGFDALSERYSVSWDQTLFDSDGYLAGHDSRRIDEFNGCLRDPDIRAIFVARGGYGSMRLLPHLDAAALRADPKLIVGFSDATALLAWTLSLGIGAVHGPVVNQFPLLSDMDKQWLWNTLEGTLTDAILPITSCHGFTSPTYEGRLVGGNLTLLAQLAGTDYKMDFSNSIVILEDIAEHAYAIDRSLTTLNLCGAWDHAVGFCVGSMTDCQDSYGIEPQDVFDRCLPTKPHMHELPVGHGNTNRAFMLGSMAVMDQTQACIRLIAH